MKRATIIVEAPRLTLADIHLALGEVTQLLVRDVVHTLPPTRIGFGLRGIAGHLIIGDPPSRVLVPRARIEGAIAELERIGRGLEEALLMDAEPIIRPAQEDLQVIADLLRKELSS